MDQCHQAGGNGTALVVSAHFWLQGDKEQGHKGENANVPSTLHIGHEGAPGPGECAHLH